MGLSALAPGAARQKDAEHRAFAYFTLHRDKTVLALDDTQRGGHRAPADIFGRKERIEDFIDDAGRNSLARVLHLQQNERPGRGVGMEAGVAHSSRLGLGQPSGAFPVAEKAPEGWRSPKPRGVQKASLRALRPPSGLRIANGITVAFEFRLGTVGT